jgi:hypothetical protein
MLVSIVPDSLSFPTWANYTAGAKIGQAGQDARPISALVALRLAAERHQTGRFAAYDDPSIFSAFAVNNAFLSCR